MSRYLRAQFLRDGPPACPAALVVPRRRAAAGRQAGATCESRRGGARRRQGDDRSKGSPSTGCPNGLRVLLLPDQTKPVATVNITYLVGSRHENYGETGMAHLLEHLLFKGSTAHPKIGEEMTSHGADFNGTTWYDRTNYFESFPATHANLEWALQLESDRMVHSFIAKSDLESEMTVVRNEYELGENDPAGHPGGAGLLHRVPVAQLRPLDHRRPVGHRAGADRPPAGLLPEVLPARQLRARRSRQVRPRHHPEAHRAALRPDSAAQPGRRQPPLGHLYRRAGAGRRTDRHAPPGRRTSRSSWPDSTSRRARTPTSRPSAS